MSGSRLKRTSERGYTEKLLQRGVTKKHNKRNERDPTIPLILRIRNPIDTTN